MSSGAQSSDKSTSVTFRPYKFEREDQELAGSIFSFEQKRMLENQLGQIMTEKAMDSPQGKDPQTYLLAQSYWAGQVEMIRWLLDASTAAESGLEELNNRQL